MPPLEPAVKAFAPTAPRPVSASSAAPRLDGLMPPSRTAVPILAYHSVGAPRHSPGDGLYNLSPGTFASHLRLLHCLGYQAITLQQAYNGLYGQGLLPARPVCITFDDAYTSVSRHAAHLLAHRGWPATVFAPTAYVGGSNVWDQQEGISARAIMDWGALRALNAQGWEIGAHSRRHVMLSGLSDGEAWEEIEGSKRDVEDHIGQAVHSFAYPYGDANARLAALVIQAGFQIACTCCPRALRQVDDPLLAPRIVLRRYNETAAALFYRLALRERLNARPMPARSDSAGSADTSEEDQDKAR